MHYYIINDNNNNNVINKYKDQQFFFISSITSNFRKNCLNPESKQSSRKNVRFGGGKKKELWSNMTPFTFFNCVISGKLFVCFDVSFF